MLKLEVDNYDDTMVKGSFTILGQKITVSDEFGFPKQNSIILAFKSSDYKIIKEYYARIKIKKDIHIILELKEDPFAQEHFNY